jgi:hypothetical protein
MFAIVKDTGNVLIRVTYQLFPSWAKALQDAGFIVELRPLTVVKKKRDVKYHRAKTRQPDTYLYIIAHKTINYYWDFGDEITKRWLPENTGNARSSYINNIAVVHSSSRLRGPDNQIIRKAENPLTEIAYLIETYCPLPGVVGDFCAGTLVSAQATLATGRTGFFGERDEQAATLGENRAMAYYMWLSTSGTLCFVTFIHTTYYGFTDGHVLILFPTMVYIFCYAGNLTRLAARQAALKLPETRDLKPAQAAKVLAGVTAEWCTDERVILLWLGKNNIPAKSVYDAYNCHIRPPSLWLHPEEEEERNNEEQALWCARSYKKGQLIVCYSGTYVNDAWLEANANSDLVKYVPIPIHI